MKRLFWMAVALMISTGVYYTIRYGLRPKPIPVMNPTKFERIDQIGVVAYKRLRSDIRSERVVLLGSSGVGDDQVWDGLVRAALADQEKLVYFSPVKVSAGEFETLVYTDADVTSGALATQIKERLRDGQLILVQGRTSAVSHLSDHSLARSLEPTLQHPVLSLSILPFALTAAEREALQPVCALGHEDVDGVGRLGCAAGRVARSYARRALDAASIWGVIERHGLKEYLLFIHAR